MPIIGLQEVLIIGGLALVVFGAPRIPQVMESLGKGIQSFRKAASTPADDTSTQTNPTGQSQTPTSGDGEKPLEGKEC